MEHERYTFFLGKIFVMGNKGQSHMILVPASIKEYLGIIRGDTIEVIMRCKGKINRKGVIKKVTGVSNSSDGIIITTEEMKAFGLSAGDQVDIKITKVKSYKARE